MKIELDEHDAEVLLKILAREETLTDEVDEMKKEALVVGRVRKQIIDASKQRVLQ